MGKIQENDARLQQLVSMARIGWWEVDFDEGVYYCSEFVADLLGIEGNKISAKDFAYFGGISLFPDDGDL